MEVLSEFLIQPLPGSPTVGWKVALGLLLTALAVVWMFIPASDD